MADFPWSLVLTVVGALMSLVGALILINLQSIKRCIGKFAERIEKQDIVIAALGKKHDELALTISSCKVDCHRTFVDSTAFLRETGFTRRTLEGQTSSLSRMEGQFALTDKLPAIVGEIARNIVKEMKDGKQ